MKLALKLFAALLAGFGTHQAYRPSLVLGERWGSLLRYVLGSLIVLPFLLLVLHDAKNEDEDERVTAAYLLVLGAVGSGTFLGHLYDRVRGSLE